MFSAVGLQVASLLPQAVSRRVFVAGERTSFGVVNLGRSLERHCCSLAGRETSLAGVPSLFTSAIIRSGCRENWAWVLLLMSQNKNASLDDDDRKDDGATISVEAANTSDAFGFTPVCTCVRRS